jgi:D-threo-aldose 1-dehydrogenase
MDDRTPPGPRSVVPRGLGLGGAPLGNLFSPVGEREAGATVAAAWDAGVRYFDTAPLYGAGLSEHRLGAFLCQRPRAEFVLSTKVGRLLDPDPAQQAEQEGYVGALPFRVRFDYSAEATHRSLRESMQRLGLARIDVAWIHDPAEDTHGAAWKDMFAQAMAGAARALAALKEAGTITAWGLGVNRIEPCLLALEQAEPDLFLLAGRYTLLDTSALEALFPACAARGVGVVVGGPYNSGLLAGGPTFDYRAAPASMLERRARIAVFCERFGVPMKAAALRFAAAHPTVAAVIAGARSAAEMRENALMMRAPVPMEFWAALKAEGLLPEAAPVPEAGG